MTGKPEFDELAHARELTVMAMNRIGRLYPEDTEKGRRLAEIFSEIVRELAREEAERT